MCFPGEFLAHVKHHVWNTVYLAEPCYISNSHLMNRYYYHSKATQAFGCQTGKRSYKTTYLAVLTIINLQKDLFWWSIFGNLLVLPGQKLRQNLFSGTSVLWKKLSNCWVGFFFLVYGIKQQRQGMITVKDDHYRWWKCPTNSKKVKNLNTTAHDKTKKKKYSKTSDLLISKKCDFQRCYGLWLTGTGCYLRRWTLFPLLKNLSSIWILSCWRGYKNLPVTFLSARAAVLYPSIQLLKFAKVFNGYWWRLRHIERDGKRKNWNTTIFSFF